MKRNIYYSFWVSLIKNYLSNEENAGKGWEKRLLFISSLIFGFSLQALFVVLEYFKIAKINLEVHIFPVGYFNHALEFTLTRALPFYIVNYFIIFYKKRYVSLMDTYKPYSKKKSLIILLIYFFLANGTVLFFSYLNGKSKVG